MTHDNRFSSYFEDRILRTICSETSSVLFDNVIPPTSSSSGWIKEGINLSVISEVVHLFQQMFLLIFLLFASSEARQITVFNKCPFTTWAGILGPGNPEGGGFRLDAGQSRVVNVADGWTAGRIWARTECDGNMHCATGSCGVRFQLEIDRNSPWASKTLTFRIARSATEPAESPQFLLPSSLSVDTKASTSTMFPLSTATTSRSSLIRKGETEIAREPVDVWRTSIRFVPPTWP